jgi:hypothetical protein
MEECEKSNMIVHLLIFSSRNMITKKGKFIFIKLYNQTFNYQAIMQLKILEKKLVLYLNQITKMTEELLSFQRKVVYLE